MITHLADGVVNRFRDRLVQKDGGCKWVDATVCPYGDGTVEGYVATIKDISGFVMSEENWDVERRRFSEEQTRLAEAEQATQLPLKMKDEFLSNVSHELRSPLTSIYSFATILDDGLAGDLSPEQKEYLAIVLKNVVQRVGIAHCPDACSSARRADPGDQPTERREHRSLHPARVPGTAQPTCC